MLSRRDSKTLEYPALLPMFGGMEKKPRFLDREVITMGRARGSDFCLDGNEVSALHCIIFRAADGYRVRDCGSRTGTRINGQMAKNAVLGNGDVLQIGPFSFEVRIPRGLESIVSSDPVHVDKLRRSRSHMVHLALRLRKKLLSSKKNSASSVTPVPGVLQDKATDLKAKIKQYDQRLNQLEESEKELLEEKESLEKLRREFQQKVMVRDDEISQRKNELEAEFQERWEGVQAELANIKTAALPIATPFIAEIDPQITRELEARKLELDAFAQKLETRDQELSDDFRDVQQQRDTLEKQKQQWDDEQIRGHKQIEQQKQAIAAAEKAIFEQKDQLGGMIDQLKSMQEGLRFQASTETAHLHEQISHLKNDLAEAKSHSVDSDRFNQVIAEVDRLKSEAKGLRASLIEKDAELAKSREDLAATMDAVKQAEMMRDEVQKFQHEMQGVQTSWQEKVRKLEADKDQLQTQLASSESENKPHDPQVAQLVAENAALKRLSDELQERFAAADAAAFAQDEIADFQAEIESLRGQLQQAKTEGVASDIEANTEIHQENQVLRRLLEETESELQKAKESLSTSLTPSHEADQFRGENEVLRKLLQEKDRVLDELHVAKFGTKEDASPEEVGKLLEENQVLRELLRDKDCLIEELKQDAEKGSGNDPHSYEAELNRFRKELEADRSRLNKEIESLRTRNVELDEATREMEMELSRERAEMARERIRLDRLREEVKSDMERMHREQEVRGSMAPLQKLREEMIQKSASNSGAKGVSDRLRSIKNLS